MGQSRIQITCKCPLFQTAADKQLFTSSLHLYSFLQHAMQFFFTQITFFLNWKSVVCERRLKKKWMAKYQSQMTSPHYFQNACMTSSRQSYFMLHAVKINTHGYYLFILLIQWNKILRLREKHLAENRQVFKLYYFSL